MNLSRTLVIIALLLGSAAGALAQTPIAIQGARIVTGEGGAIERGVILITGDRITAVGPSVDVPPGAQVIDGAGLTVYPGLIDAFCLAGVAAPPTAPSAAQSSGPAPQRRRPQAGPPTPPAAPLIWRKATDGFNGKSAALQALRNNGFTAALFGTRGVLTPGEDALMVLSPTDPQALRGRAAVNVNTLSRGSAYPGTLMGAYAFLRQALYDGVDQRNRKPEKPDPRLEALGEAAAGQVPLFYAAQTENDIRRAVRLGREFNARLMILGGREADKAIPLLKERGTPVILTDDWTPALALHKAGIPFALASAKIEMSVSEANEQREKMVALVDKGLPPESVLAGLTRTPAELLNFAADLGVVKPGRLANLTVVEGDLFKKESKVRFVLVQGVRIDSAPVAAQGPAKGRVPEDGVPYVNVSEDDADGHDGGETE